MYDHLNGLTEQKSIHTHKAIVRASKKMDEIFNIDEVGLIIIILYINLHKYVFYIYILLWVKFMRIIAPLFLLLTLPSFRSLRYR